MRKQDADAIIEVLDRTWCNTTPGSEYPNSRCLGMAISDTAPQVMGEVEEQVRLLFPGRVRTPGVLTIPMFQCCGSKAIPAFNNHPATTLDDARLVVSSAVS